MGDVYLCLEGGPGVAEEASLAFARGARVVPLAFLGGAGSGAFGFPEAALEPPHWCSAADWERLSEPFNELDTVDAVAGAPKSMAYPSYHSMNQGQRDEERLVFSALQGPHHLGGPARPQQQR